jgi:hypothetical protein
MQLMFNFRFNINLLETCLLETVGTKTYFNLFLDWVFALFYCNAFSIAS